MSMSDIVLLHWPLMLWTWKKPRSRSAQGCSRLVSGPNIAVAEKCVIEGSQALVGMSALPMIMFGGEGLVVVLRVPVLLWTLVWTILRFALPVLREHFVARFIVRPEVLIVLR